MTSKLAIASLSEAKASDKLQDGSRRLSLRGFSREACLRRGGPPMIKFGRKVRIPSASVRLAKSRARIVETHRTTATSTFYQAKIKFGRFLSWTELSSQKRAKCLNRGYNVIPIKPARKPRSCTGLLTVVTTPEAIEVARERSRPRCVDNHG